MSRVVGWNRDILKQQLQRASQHVQWFYKEKDYYRGVYQNKLFNFVNPLRWELCDIIYRISHMRKRTSHQIRKDP